METIREREKKKYQMLLTLKLALADFCTRSFGDMIQYCYPNKSEYFQLDV